MNKLILTRGIQGSGKSTWAKKWAEQDPEHRIRVNFDDIRNMLGKYWVPSRELLVGKIAQCAVSEGIAEKKDIVIDNMNLSVKSTAPFLELVKDTDYTVEYKDFKTPLEECIARDAQRPQPIGETVIRNTYNKYKHFYE